MKLERLNLKNFRNSEAAEIPLSSRCNFFIGANGQGKTSVLEAVGILSTLRSFRGSKSSEWLRFGSAAGEIKGQLSLGEGTQRLTTELRVAFTLEEKQAHINDKPFKSSAKYLSQRFGSIELGFHAIVFNPSDHEMVRGEPSLRRAWLDRVLAAEDVSYLNQWRLYKRTLEQKNSLLKEFHGSQSAVLQTFNESLVQYGVEITAKRLEWIERAAPKLEEYSRLLAPTQPRLGIHYLSSWQRGNSAEKNNNINNLSSFDFTGLTPQASLELLEQSFWKQLSLMREAEFRSRHALVGPHRDDWLFTLGENPLKGHGSQGEVRTALLALKLTELELFQMKTGHLPVFLLDDLSSELDQARRVFLIEYLSKSDLQVFVTTTEEMLLREFESGKQFRVEAGVSKT